MADLQNAAQALIKELVQQGLTPAEAAEQVAKSAYASATALPGMQSVQAIAAAVAAVDTDVIDFDSPTPQAAEQSVKAPASKAAKTKKRTVADHLDQALVEQKQPELAGLPTKGGKKPARTVVDDIADAVQDRKDSAKMVATVAEMQQLEMSLFQVAPWDDDLRAIPNDWGRSAVFTTRNKRTKRDACEDKLIYHYNREIEITYTGIELRADDDELVWQQILEYAKHSPIGNNVEFTLYQLCTDLGWHINEFYYKRALSCLKRLKATCFTIKSPRHSTLKNLSLLGDFDIVKVGKKRAVCNAQLDPYIVVLFANDHYSKVMWSKYRTLSPTARRMFDYFVTHAAPYPLKLETFRLICGSESTRPKKWAEQSRDACKELEVVGLVQKTWVERGFIHCLR
ncbi:plasmid replication initiator TrfA (plasmid) [Pseudomonas sp. WOUb67]|uniref:plasmid replication initiator TrfA n=1 Tax=Pseudomonas sp. WOUb67 TaxID=3161136 RepID=UPI003CF71ADF